jgi:hypothetical protein
MWEARPGRRRNTRPPMPSHPRGAGGQCYAQCYAVTA